MRDPNTHPAFIARHVVNPIRTHLAYAQVLIRKVIDIHQGRRSLLFPLLARIFELTYQLLLLGVHGDGWQASPQKLFDGAVNKLKLRIAIAMGAAFTAFAIGL